MGRLKQPIELVKAKGKKHLTKAEIAERQASEIKPINADIIAPAYLTKAQQKHFYEIGDQLKKLKVINETDTDALARYIISNDFYINAVKQLRKPKIKNDYLAFESWTKIEEKYFKQCRVSASDLGLTITSRCKIVIPASNTEKPKHNKFERFEKSVNG